MAMLQQAVGQVNAAFVTLSLTFKNVLLCGNENGINLRI